MVVDDERDTVITLSAILRHEGYETRAAYNGNEALDFLRDFDPDVVVLDISMPVMNGWETAREIRKRCGRKRPMLIAVSGQFTKGADRVLADMVGFDHFCPKPCAPASLLGWIATLVLSK